MAIVNGLSLPNPLSNGTTADAVQVMADFNALLSAVNRALLDSGGGSGMNAQSTQIHNLANGTSANDAINLSQLGAYAALAGAGFIGPLTGTTLGLSSTLNVAGAATLAALTASGLITGNSGFSGTTLSLSGSATLSGNLTSAHVDVSGALALNVNAGNVSALYFKDASAGQPYLIAQTDNNFVFNATDGSGNPRPIWNVICHSGVSPFNINPAVTLQSTLSVAGAATLQSTLGVTGASTLAALTASGLITGNAGFSGTTLGLSGLATLTTLNVSGQTNLGNATGTPNGTAANGLGFLGVPQNLHTANYTLALGDASVGQDFNGTSLVCTIPANASVAFPIGAVIPITNLNSTSLSIQITTDTLSLAGTATTGTRTLAQNGVATIRKVTSTSWIIAGAGLS